MVVLKALVISTFFSGLSLAASAKDWGSRSIYQVSRVHRLLLRTYANVTSLSLTGLHLRMGLGQLATRRIASTVGETTKAS